MSELRVFVVIAVAAMFMGCGEVEGWQPSSGSRLSSSSHDNLSSLNSSSSINQKPSSGSCVPMDINLNLQDAPDSSYVHGSIKVRLDTYKISLNLITQGQYKTIMGENPSKGEKNDTLPVEGVSWIKAEEFCRKLSEEMCLNASAIKLPTEAQWEYSAYPTVAVIRRYNEYYEWTNDCFSEEFPWEAIYPDKSEQPNCPENYPKVVKGTANLGIERRSGVFPDWEDMGIGGGYISFRVAVKNKDLNKDL